MDTVKNIFFVAISLLIATMILYKFGQGLQREKEENGVYFTPEAKFCYLFELGLSRREKVQMNVYSNNPKHNCKTFFLYCDGIEKNLDTIRITRPDGFIVIEKKKIEYMSLSLKDTGDTGAGEMES